MRLIFASSLIACYGIAAAFTSTIASIKSTKPIHELSKTSSTFANTKEARGLFDTPAFVTNGPTSTALDLSSYSFSFLGAMNGTLATLFDPASMAQSGLEQQQHEGLFSQSRPTIREILNTLPKDSFHFLGNDAMKISSVTWDYEKVIPGSLYFCLENEEFQEAHIENDALNHWTDALGAGAKCLVCKRGAIRVKPFDVGLIEVDDVNIAMAHLSRAFHGDPFSSVKVIGVTGTNGKTTTTQMINSILSRIGARSGTIGTLGTFFPSGKKWEANHLSNPLATELFEIGREMEKENAEFLSMEVTSHAMAFHRNHAIDFDVAVFTNLSQDHLDFHKTMEAYKEAKMMLFQQLGTGNKGRLPTGIVNIDDEYGTDFVNVIDKEKASAVTYGIHNKKADFVAVPQDMTSSGSTFDVYFKGHRISHINLPLPGLFNIHNALGAIAASFAMGISAEDIESGLASMKRIAGRFEAVECGSDFEVYVDFAHTPDALEKILKEVRGMTDKRMITVFSCNGDRDRTKRGEMGRIACELSDVPIVTMGSARSESPHKIIEDILEGLTESMKNDLIIELDRRDAIYEAMKMARKGDSIVLAGMGHKTEQVFNNTAFHHSDSEVVQDFMDLHFSP